MAKNRTRQAEENLAEQNLEERNESDSSQKTAEDIALSKPDLLEKTLSGLIFQAWCGIAVWMAFGLLLEGFIGFRTPVYLLDPTRRELFRLAHAHGTLLSLLLLGAAFSLKQNSLAENKYGVLALKIGTVLMPAGFFLGGIYTFGSDPNFLIIFAPIGGLGVILGAISLAISGSKR